MFHCNGWCYPWTVPMLNGKTICLRNVDIKKTMQFHKKHKKLVTMTAAIPEGRFGSITFKGDRISTIKEKQDNSDKFVNAGFFVVNKDALKYIKNSNSLASNTNINNCIPK